jgi:hypothetical protein
MRSKKEERRKKKEERGGDIHFRSPSTHCPNHPSCFKITPLNPSHSNSDDPVAKDVSPRSNPPVFTDSSNKIV